MSCTDPFPNAAFIRYIWPCLSDWDDICGTKWRLKCPKIFFLEWKKGENNNKNAHHSIQSERLPCSQSTGLSSWSLLSSVYLFSAVYRSNWYGCGPYCLLAFSGSILSSSESLLSQDKCRWSSSPAMFQVLHKWSTSRKIRNRTGSCISLDYRWKFQYFMADIERTRASSGLGFEIRYYWR